MLTIINVEEKELHSCKILDWTMTYGLAQMVRLARLGNGHACGAVFGGDATFHARTFNVRLGAEELFLESGYSIQFL